MRVKVRRFIYNEPVETFKDIDTVHGGSDIDSAIIWVGTPDDSSHDIVVTVAAAARVEPRGDTLWVTGKGRVGDA